LTELVDMFLQEQQKNENKPDYVMGPYDNRPPNEDGESQPLAAQGASNISLAIHSSVYILMTL
jgi:hypothetical protein